MLSRCLYYTKNKADCQDGTVVCSFSGRKVGNVFLLHSYRCQYFACNKAPAFICLDSVLLPPEEACCLRVQKTKSWHLTIMCCTVYLDRDPLFEGCFLMIETQFDPENKDFSIEKEIAPNEMHGYTQYYATFHNIAGSKCPQVKKPGPHNIKFRKFEDCSPRYDMVRGEPALVYLKVPRYWCKECRCSFLQTNRSYQYKNKTTPEFDEYIAQSLIADVKLTERKIADTYTLLSRTTVFNILKGFMDRVKTIPFTEMDCEEIWFVPVKIGKQKRLVIFGEPTENQRKILKDCLDGDQFVLLGFAGGLTYRSAFEEGMSLSKAKHSLIINVPEYMKDTSDKEDRKRIKRIHVWYELPDEIGRVTKVIEKMSSRGISYAAVKLRTMFYDDFRLFEIKKANMAQWWDSVKPIENTLKCSFVTSRYSGIYIYKDYDGREVISLHRQDRFQVPWGEGEICGPEDEAVCYYWSSIHKFLERYE